MSNDSSQQVYWEAEHGHRGYDHPVVAAFARQRVRFIESFLKLEELQNALDVGCGSGFSTYYMGEKVPEVFGVDRSEKMLAMHPLKDTGRLKCCSAFELPYEDGQFDLVFGWEILHHLSEPEIALREMVRVSRRYVLVAEPNPLNPAQLAFSYLDPHHAWVRRFGMGNMRRMMDKSGLRLGYSASGGWLLPNVTPPWLLGFLLRIPYKLPFGISNWVLGEKIAQGAESQPQEEPVS